MRFEQAAVIGAPPERVWSVVSDWERQASWMPDVSRIEVRGPKRELGASMTVRTKVFGIPAATDLVRVTVWEPPRRLVVDHVGVVTGTGQWRLDPVDERSTRFTWIEEIRMMPPVLGSIALWLYAPWQRWMLRRSIGNLKRIAESG
ncbi:MAG: SRPBCC family protein [Actinobacteria bacterium]|nr:MAG: SRPBCC family protein [Actinomycetota bacterium]